MEIAIPTLMASVFAEIISACIDLASPTALVAWDITATTNPAL